VGKLNIKADVWNEFVVRKEQAIKQQLNKLAPFDVERQRSRWCRLSSGGLQGRRAGGVAGSL